MQWTIDFQDVVDYLASREPRHAVDAILKAFKLSGNRAAIMGMLLDALKGTISDALKNTISDLHIKEG